ncbi:MAG TPA: [FeFe] hydrogenase H-cluster maturation GTPase HydF, partial [Bacillota bacterium]|nr:[FeFe] hydrogenase H-cluster maturation GTPase HydF [Bacillota bacterium]
LAQSVGGLGEGPPIVGDLVSCGDMVVLVIPADAQAPKGRLILPQVQTIRDVLDHEGIAVAVRIDQLRQLFADKDFLPRLVVTDSQAFGEVAPVVPESVPMTSFSILFARHKGDFELLVEGARAIEGLEPGDVVLISEACTHHPIEDDIGTVKIPRLLNAKVGGELRYEWQRGGDFPEDLDRFKLVINCGGCMLNRREMCSRLEAVADAAVPVTNYGMAIAACLGILPRALRPFAL